MRHHLNTIARKLDRFFNGFCLGPGRCAEMNLRKSGSKILVGFEPRACLVRLERIKHSSYSVSADWDLKPGPLLFVYKGSILDTEVMSISTTRTKTKSLLMLTLKPRDCGPDPKTKSISTTYTKPSQSITTLKKKSIFGPHTINFDPPHREQVNFGPNTKTTSNSIPHMKINLIWRLYWSQVNFDARHKNQVSFDPDTKPKYSSTPAQQTKSILLQTLKLNHVQSPHWNQANFHHPHKNQTKLDLTHKN